MKITVSGKCQQVASILWLIIYTTLFYSCELRTKNKEGQTSKVTVAYIGDERILFQDYWGMEASYLMFLPMFTNTGEDFSEIEGVLAERWEHSNDFKEWTFHIRKGINWHDSVPVTAHDIAFTQGLRASEKKLRGIKDPVITVLDDYTLKMVYEVPTEGRDNWTVYYPKHLLKDLDPKDFFKWDFWTHPVGNGPYKFVRNVPQTMVELEANQDYFKGKPRIDRVILKFTSSSSPLQLLSKDVDAITYASSDLLLKISNDERFNTYFWWGDWLEVIYWNHKHPLFREPEIRKALTMGIDRQGLARLNNYPSDIPVLDVITSPRQFKKRNYPKPIPYDPDSAIKILSTFGWKDTNGDGIVDKSSKDFRFTLLQSRENEKSGIFIQDQLRKIGVAIELKSVEINILRKKQRAGDFESLLGGLSNSIDQHNSGQIKMFGEGNVMGYNNEEVKSLLAKAGLTIEDESKDKIYERLISIFQKDFPVTILMPKVQFHITNKRIKGLRNISRPDPVWFMEYLWLEND